MDISTLKPPFLYIFDNPKMIAKIRFFSMDPTEYTCIKALLLFQPNLINLTQKSQIELLQDQTHLMLQVRQITLYILLFYLVHIL